MDECRLVRVFCELHPQNLVKEFKRWEEIKIKRITKNKENRKNKDKNKERQNIFGV